MSFIDELNLSYFKIKIKETDELVNGEYGSYSRNKHLILINKHQPELEKVNTLLHEVLHVIFDVYNLDKTNEEHLVSCISNGLTESFYRNPALVKLLSKFNE